MASQHVLNLSESTFESEVIQSAVPVLVDFWAPWCGPCRMLSPVIDEIAEAKAGAAKVAKVNVDDCPGLAARYGINSIPALLFFKGGQPVDRLVGAAPKSTLVSKLETLV